MVSPFRLLRCSALLAALMLCAASAWSVDAGTGFGIGPGMVLVENLKPGAEKVDVFGGTGSFVVYNGTDKSQVFTIAVKKVSSVLGSWELGYRDIPDISWCSLDKEEIEVDSKSEGKVNLFVKVPDKPEYYNQKWMVVVCCSPGKSKASGVVGLQVASRVQLETLAEPVSKEIFGDTALVPSITEMPETQPGTSWTALAKFTNNAKEEHTYSLKRIGDVEKENTHHERYYGKGCTPVLKDEWIELDKPFALKAGETKALAMKVNVPAAATRGKSYEELVFFVDEKGKVADFLRARSIIALQPLADIEPAKKP
jgi:hypothetical protein